MLYAELFLFDLSCSWETCVKTYPLKYQYDKRNIKWYLMHSKTKNNNRSQYSLLSMKSTTMQPNVKRWKITVTLQFQNLSPNPNWKQGQISQKKSILTFSTTVHSWLWLSNSIRFSCLVYVLNPTSYRFKYKFSYKV